MTSIGDYNKIMSDHDIFNQIVYTPLSEAIRLLEERKKDPILLQKVNKLLKDNLPVFLNNDNLNAVLLRQVATPNYEIRLFMAVTKENNLHPIICEYYDDKFSSNNNYKHSLGQLRVKEICSDKNNNFIFEKISIIDFNKNNGKKIGEVLTLWGEKLVDFHRSIFDNHFKGEKFTVWNGSEWYKNKHINNNVSEHYKNLFSFFICNGILFENFLTSKDSEGDFTKKFVLPTIEEIINLTGVKPLIVPIPPMDMEDEDYWYYHLPEVKDFIPHNKHD